MPNISDHWDLKHIKPKRSGNFISEARQLSERISGSESIDYENS
jgi:hypothetical protein